jgi:hypothetical protein
VVWTEPLLTPIDTYYYNLSLLRKAEREALNYHSFTFNNWIVTDDVYKTAGWGDSLLKEGFLILDPSFLFSYNTHYPYGMNDGALWQGRGLNFRANAGVRTKYSIFSVTVSPVVWYAQNVGFSMTPSDPGHANRYSSFIPNIDWPQRHGDNYTLNYDWGDSEIRLDYEGFTLGFGTQNVWLGPTRRNALISSNNAGGIPKMDIGYRDYDTWMGGFEVFVWWGQLQESSYFDDALALSQNRLYTGFSFSFRPDIISGLILGFHRTMVSPWDSFLANDLLTVFNPKTGSGSYGNDENDQRASVTFEWTFPEVGFSLYGEWARNDFGTNRRLMTALEHSSFFSLGMSKVIAAGNDGFFVFNFEISDLLKSRDYLINLTGNGRDGVYSHHIVRQGYTQKGQIIGAGIGPGSDSQYASLRYQTKKGYIGLFFERTAVVKDYIYGNPAAQSGDHWRLQTRINAGIDFLYTIDRWVFFGEFMLMDTLNWNYKAYSDKWNIHLMLGFCYKIR